MEPVTALLPIRLFTILATPAVKLIPYIFPAAVPVKLKFCMILFEMVEGEIIPRVRYIP